MRGKRIARCGRTAAIPLPADLAGRTQFRVRLRAMELRERQPQRRMLWLACAASWIFGIASAPYVWRVFEWFGHVTGAPKLILEIGFGLWWTIPALFAVLVLLLEGAGEAEEPEWTKPGRWEGSSAKSRSLAAVRQRRDRVRDDTLSGPKQFAWQEREKWRITHKK